MRLGLTLPLAGVDVGEAVGLAAAAEDAGFEDCWLAEMAGPDSVSLAGALAVTTGLRVGTGIVAVQTRSPFVLAMTAATLARLSGGRFVLGLGASSEAIVSGWNGVPYERPLARVRETVTVVRALLRGEKVTYAGETLRLSGGRLTVLPDRPVPVHVAALNTGMLRLAGAVADGVVLVLRGPHHLAAAREVVAEGARDAGRDPSEVEIVVRVPVALGDDPDERARRLRAALVTYLGVPAYNRYLASLGYREEAERARAAWAAGDRAGTLAAVSDGLLGEVAVSGDAAACRLGIDRYRAAGVDALALLPVAGDLEAHRAAVATLAPRP